MTVNESEYADGLGAGEASDDSASDIDLSGDFFTAPDSGGKGDPAGGEFDWGPEGEEALTADYGQGDFELAERHALRRVAGLSTELDDVSEVEYRKLRLERVVLVGVWTEGSVEDADNSLVELKLLAETAGSLVLDALSQRRQKPDPATYIGPGKVDHVRLVVAETGADTVICDGELSPRSCGTSKTGSRSRSSTGRR